MSHTPEPWIIDRTNALGPMGIIVENERGYYDTLCNFAASREQLGREQTEANARLIASSPNLLEACKAMIAHLDHWQAAWITPASDDSKPVYDQLVSAVKKAERGSE